MEHAKADPGEEVVLDASESHYVDGASAATRLLILEKPKQIMAKHLLNKAFIHA